MQDELWHRPSVGEPGWHYSYAAKANLLLLALANSDREFLDRVRTSLVVAHPDDEAIGFGGQLPRIANLWLVHTTDGAPRDGVHARAAGFSGWQSYADARKRELEAAMIEAGVDQGRLISLSIPDKEAIYNLVEITRALAAFFHTHEVEVVITHAYEGGHSDHDATAFAVHAAAALVSQSGGGAPAIVEMPLYHWRADAIVSLRFCPGSKASEVVLPLAPLALAAKARMLAAYRTQAAFLSRFTSNVERFRAAPHYDFGQPANRGEVGYRHITPEIDGEVWCSLAQQAWESLALECR